MKNVLGTRHSLRSTRKLTIIAQDPAFRIDGRIVRAFVDVPAEELLPGPCGYRVNVIDYDVTANLLYEPAQLPSGLEADEDPFANATDEELLSNPRFHAQNVYAIVMRTLARFEFALGRRVRWGSKGHQLHIAPHAFAEANAFYSREDRGLFFGYFEGFPEDDGSTSTVFTCLAHDVVAHEATHAILDGLRQGFLEPSLPDQAAFHEGFSDVVALLSVFAVPAVVSAMLDGRPDDPLIGVEHLTEEALRRSALVNLALEMGQALSGVRGEALRNSLTLKPDARLIHKAEFQEEHRRGELLVAAMIRSFLDIWLRRLSRVGVIEEGRKDRGLVVEEGARAADHLLTMAIRAIDYCPPVDLSFSDYLSALLTVDREVVPDDRYGYRDSLLRNFAAFGIQPSSAADSDGTWLRCDTQMVTSRSHFESLLRDEQEMFRFIWENRKALDLGDVGYIEVLSVRPSVRLAPDGFTIRETISEYRQILTMTAEELRGEFGVPVPEAIPKWQRLRVFGGGALVFDEYGQLKYQIANHLFRDERDVRRQGLRLRHLWEQGLLEETPDPASRFSAMHLSRSGAQGVGA